MRTGNAALFTCSSQLYLRVWPGRNKNHSFIPKSTHKPAKGASENAKVCTSVLFPPFYFHPLCMCLYFFPTATLLCRAEAKALKVKNLYITPNPQILFV